jgi:hypothetical protein
MKPAEIDEIHDDDDAGVFVVAAEHTRGPSSILVLLSLFCGYTTTDNTTQTSKDLLFHFERCLVCKKEEFLVFELIDATVRSLVYDDVDPSYFQAISCDVQHCLSINELYFQSSMLWGRMLLGH